MSFCQQLTLLLPINWCTIPAFYLGSGVGLVCAMIGAAVEYKRARVRSRAGQEDGQLPGCMIMMAGALGMAGGVAIVISLFTDQLQRALLLGAGIGSGFLTGFLVLAGLWVLLVRERGH